MILFVKLSKRILESAGCWWLMTVTLATWEAEIRGSQF
jgi:hypothetical protein